jgi:FdhE protein
MGHKKNGLTPEGVNRQIQDLMSESYIAPAYLQLFQEIFNVQYQTEIKLQAKNLYTSIDQREADKRREQGLPILDPAKLQFDEKELIDLLQKINQLLSKHDTAKNLAPSRLLEAEESGKLSLCEVVRGIMTDNKKYLRWVSEETVTDEEEIISFARAIASPFLRVCAGDINQRVDIDRSPANSCPVCGGTPMMAKLQQKDGKRVLECSLCNTQWRFKRLRCPFCGNEDQNTLGFFFSEEHSAYRVDKCDKCKHYIKTVDERQKTEDKLKALAIEDLATLYLDILAEKEGYESINKSC